jgi:hypothetical protein
MTIRFRDLSGKRIWQLVWPFLLSVAAGSVLHNYYRCTWWFYHPMMAISDGLIVAGVVGLLLEIFATKFLIQKTADSLAENLVGRGLPRKIQARIQEIANTTLVRDHYVKTYKLTAAGQGNLTVETTTTFEVKNYGWRTERYVPEMDEERVFNPEFQYLHYSLKEEVHSLDAAALKKRVESKHDKPTTLQTSGDKAVKLGPIAEDPSAICRVKWVLRVTMPEQFVDLTEFRYATVGAQIFVEEMPDDLEFCCTGVSKDSRTWEFAEPFLRGQQIKVWWLKK